MKLIRIAPYNENWPCEFDEIGKAIRSAVGEKALAIHHIGSTSVDGLAAKDVIDIQMTVANLDVALDVLLAKAGFTRAEDVTEDHRPPGRYDIPEEQLTKLYYRYGNRSAHLHVRKQGYFNQRYALLCRDYLRANKACSNAYCEVKEQLAKRFPHDQDAYYAIKDPVFDIIIAGAELWRHKQIGKNPKLINNNLSTATKTKFYEKVLPDPYYDGCFYSLIY